MIKIAGKVTHGKGKGRKLGFPTANLDFRKGIKSGVYSGVVKVGGSTYKAGIFVSRDGKRLEAHLVDFAGDLLNKEIDVEIREKIREISDFKNDEELREQISKDIEIIRLRK